MFYLKNRKIYLSTAHYLNVFRFNCISLNTDFFGPAAILILIADGYKRCTNILVPWVRRPFPFLLFFPFLFHFIYLLYFLTCLSSYVNKRSIHFIKSLFATIEVSMLHKKLIFIIIQSHGAHYKCMYIVNLFSFNNSINDDDTRRDYNATTHIPKLAYARVPFRLRRQKYLTMPILTALTSLTTTNKLISTLSPNLYTSHAHAHLDTFLWNQSVVSNPYNINPPMGGIKI